MDPDQQVFFLDSLLSESEKGDKGIGRIVYIYGEFNQSLAKDTVTSIFELVAENSTKPIALLIDSIGGDIDSLFSIVDLIEIIPNPVYTIVIGKAMSAAALLTMVGKKGHRYAFKNARFMTHELLMSQQGYSTLTEHQNEVRELKELQTILDSIVLKSTNIKKADLKKYVSSKDFYMPPLKAKELGIIDAIVDKKIMKEIIELFIVQEKEESSCQPSKTTKKS